jgi:hypothetical protein
MEGCDFSEAVEIVTFSKEICMQACTDLELAV